MRERGRGSVKYKDDKPVSERVHICRGVKWAQRDTTLSTWTLPQLIRKRSQARGSQCLQDLQISLQRAAPKKAGEKRRTRTHVYTSDRRERKQEDGAHTRKRRTNTSMLSRSPSSLARTRAPHRRASARRESAAAHSLWAGEYTHPLHAQ